MRTLVWGGVFGKWARLPGWVRGGGRLRIASRALAYGVAGFGLMTTLTAMAALHPHQQVYFNALVDAKTPGALGERYDMDYWQIAHRQSLEYLLARYPDDTLRVFYPGNDNKLILPKNDRERIVHARYINADFYFDRRHQHHYWRDAPDPPIFHSVQAYGSGIAHILAPNSAAYIDFYRAVYEDVEANGTLLARAAFDIYVHNGELRYISASCASLLAGSGPNPGMFLRITPADPADLPTDRREFGFEDMDFWIRERAAFFEGRCVIRSPLPDYPIARISTGHHFKGEARWRADIDLAARALYERIAAGRYGQPVAQSDFDVYLDGDSLAYLKENCDQRDLDGRFLLHIIPDDPADLPADSREYGFENMNFRFADHGADIGGKCVIERELPGYAIGRIRTGQFVSGGGWLWSAEFPAAR